jgi:hypothetical protein
MSNKAFQRALDCLAHPLALTAVALLALNALVLQPRWPSWWTGKVGDVAWLFFVPFLVAALLSWLVPRRLATQEQVVGLAAVTVAGLAFTLVKTVPAVNALATTAFLQLTGHAAKLRLDPTDLLALPALVGAWFLWEKAPRRSAQPLLRGLVLLVAVAVTAADAAQPYSEGFACLLEEDDTLVAVEKYADTADRTTIWHTYRSADGGLTWHKDAGEREDNPCVGKTVPTWPIRDQRHLLEYTFVAGEGVYARRYDGPMAPHLSLPLPKGVAITGAIFHEPTGNIVLTLGPDQIMVKPPDGPWQPHFPIAQTELLGKSIIRPTQPTLTPRPTRPTSTPSPTPSTPTPRPIPTPAPIVRYRDPTVAPRGLVLMNGQYYLLDRGTEIGDPSRVYSGDPTSNWAPGLYQMVILYTIVLDIPRSHVFTVVDKAGNVLYQYELWTVSAALYDPEGQDLVVRQVVVWREGQLIGGVGEIPYGEGGENRFKSPAEKDEVFALLRPGHAVLIQLTVGLSTENYQQILSQYVTSPFPGTDMDQDLYFYGILLGADPERHLPELPCITAEELARWTDQTALPPIRVLGIASNIKAIYGQ